MNTSTKIAAALAFTFFVYIVANNQFPAYKKVIFG